jgi:hypothetical protein
VEDLEWFPSRKWKPEKPRNKKFRFSVSGDLD